MLQRHLGVFRMIKNLWIRIEVEIFFKKEKEEREYSIIIH